MAASLPFVEDANAIAHLLGDLEDVRRHKDGGAAIGDLAEDVFHDPGAAGIEPVRWLVEKEDLGF